MKSLGSASFAVAKSILTGFGPIDSLARVGGCERDLFTDSGFDPDKVLSFVACCREGMPCSVSIGPEISFSFTTGCVIDAFFTALGDDASFRFEVAFPLAVPGEVLPLTTRVLFTGAARAL